MLNTTDRMTRLRVEGLELRDSLLVWIFSTTLFLSAGLLFLLEPMFAKMALPFLGGTTAVWATCMVFYQAMLLVGYAFANLMTRVLSRRQQALLLVVLAFVPFLVMPLSFPESRIPPVEQNPIPWLLMILTTIVGLPFFVMSTVAPSLQKWFEGVGHERSGDPYFLYAASNAGSLIGLMSYPVLVEPYLTLSEQSRMWEAGYALLLLMVIFCAVELWRSPQQARPTDITRHSDGPQTSALSIKERLLWVALAFVPSSLMLGVTTVLTTEISPIPMLWVLPLAVYLLSFILVFAKKPLLSHAGIAESMPLVILAGMLPLLLRGSWPLFLDISINLLILFIVAVACHGELAKRRPSTEHLTGFYLWIAFGGVLGGLFNSIVAPLVFKTVVEYPLALVCAALLLQVIRPASDNQRFNWRDAVLPFVVAAMAAAPMLLVRAPRFFGDDPGPVLHIIAFGPAILLCLSFSKRPIRFVLGFVALTIVASGYTGAFQHVLSTQRNFYGIKRVAVDDKQQYHILFSGKTIHGIQSLSPGKNREPLSYFSRSGPIGQVFGALAGSQQLQEVGIAGLGAGSIACYQTLGEKFTFFEIDPMVERIARDPRYFTFLQDCAPNARVVLGDARISLKSVADHHFGMFIVDVFGGDAIPFHLLTREALQLYLSKLDSRGILAIHISNRYLELDKVVSSLADDAGLVALIQRDKSRGAGTLPSTWVVLARRADELGSLSGDARWTVLNRNQRKRVWTDDYSSVLNVFVWN